MLQCVHVAVQDVQEQPLLRTGRCSDVCFFFGPQWSSKTWPPKFTELKPRGWRSTTVNRSPTPGHPDRKRYLGLKYWCNSPTDWVSWTWWRIEVFPAGRARPLAARRRRRRVAWVDGEMEGWGWIASRWRHPPTMPIIDPWLRPRVDESVDLRSARQP